MKDQFFIHFEYGMPKGTAQMKRYNGRTGTYFKDKNLQNAEWLFRLGLEPHAPKQPSELPIKLSIWFYFDVKSKKLWGKPKTSKPDVDNYSKAFIDQMTKCGFWLDDSQIVELDLHKFYAEKATILVRYEEIISEQSERQLT